MVPTNFTSAQSSELTDITGSYAHNEITALATSGIINGYEDGSFHPQAKMTRAEFAAILTRTLKLAPNAEASASFTDVDDWAKPYVGALVSTGLTKGTSETTFGAKDPITREQLAVFFMRALGANTLAEKLNLPNTFTDKDSGSDFPDEKNLSSYAKSYVGLAQSIGFLKGIDNGDGTVRFDPTSQAERQAVARLSYEFFTNQDAYKAKLQSTEKIAEVLDKSAQVLNSAASYRIHTTMSKSPDNITLVDSTTEYTKEPRVIHETGVTSMRGRTGAINNDNYELYISNGHQYNLQDDGSWTVTTPKQLSLSADSMNGDAVVSPFLTVTEDENSYLITGSITPQYYSRAFQRIYGDNYIDWSVFKQVSYNMTIDKTTYQPKTLEQEIQYADGSTGILTIAIDNYNALPAIQLPPEALNATAQ